MFKLAIPAALLVFLASIVCAVLLPGVTEGFRYFIVMAGVVLGLFAACGILESRDS